MLSPHAIGYVSNRYVCATLDWWPTDKCDYGRCPWGGGSMLTADLDDPLLLAAARRLAPFLLRLGGSLSDSIVYEEDDGCAPRPPPELSEDPPDPGVDGGLSDGGGGGVDGGRSARRRCLSTCGPEAMIKDERVRVGFRGGCLSRARWSELVSFCERAGCEIILSVNALRGRRRVPCAGIDCRRTKPPPPCCLNYTGSWDSSNTASLLRHAARHRHPLAAVAYGNELGGHAAIAARLSPAEYAAGLSVLRRLISEMWSVADGGDARARRAPPRVLGPNAQLDASWVAPLLDADPQLTSVSHHLYSLGAGSIDGGELIGKILRADFLDKLGVTAANAVRMVDDGAARHAFAAAAATRAARAAWAGTTAQPELWVTEMGGAYNSGRPGVTDAFVSAFWYADALGTLAAHRTKVVCRQTLLGGSYGLIALGNARRTPLANASAPGAMPPARGVMPDFWVAALWRRLMGERVLSVWLAPVGEAGAVAPVRAYAACAASGARAPVGAVALVIINQRNHPVPIELATLLVHFAPAESIASASARPTGVATSTTAACRAGVLAPPWRLPGSGGEAAVWEECAKRCAANPACSAFGITRLTALAAGGADGPASIPMVATDAPMSECLLHGGADAAGDEALDGAAGSAQTGRRCFVRRGDASSSVKAVAERHEWQLTASSLTSSEAMLNGQPLRAEVRARGELPEMPPRVVHANSTPAAPALDSVFGAPGHSVSFVVLPEARWPACQ